MSGIKLNYVYKIINKKEYDVLDEETNRYKSS